MSTFSRILAASTLALGLASAVAAEPIFTITEDGSTFIYKAKPGDHPGTVAAMFGIDARAVPAFLAANAITDPARVGVGHVYRVPNPLASRAADAEAKTQVLEHDVGELRVRTEQLAHDLDAARTATAGAERRIAEFSRLERLWPLASIVGMLLVVAAGVLGWIAFSALRKTDVAERRARALADEVEEKTRAALAERQHAAKHVLDLEAKVRDLELRLGARPIAPARRSPAGAG
jgi:hypothetical protein